MTTAIVRLAGLGALLVVATSLPPSARPLVAAGRAKPVKETPASDSQQPHRDTQQNGDSEPAQFVSVEIGAVWTPASAAGQDRIHATDVSSGGAETFAAVLSDPDELNRFACSTVDRCASAATTVSTLRTFLIALRPHAPPAA